MRVVESHIAQPQSSPHRRARLGGGLVEWLVVLCVFTSCSRGGHSDHASSAPVEPVATANGHDIPFATCPTNAPSTTHPTTDAVPAALARTLVPIAATAIRVCEYAADRRLIATGVVRDPHTAATLLAETNRLTAGAATPDCRDSFEPRFFLTFSNGTTDIDVADAGDCGFVTNGRMIAVGVPTWRLDLARAGLTGVADHQLPIPTGPGPYRSTRQYLTGTLAGDGRCFWVEGADHSRTDVIWPPGYTARAQPLRVIDFGFHVVGVVGQDVAVGGKRAEVSPEQLAAVASNVRGCLPAATCRGAACSIWLAA